MRFAHLSDCHIGGWRDSKLRELGLKSFVKAAEISLKNKTDFILISGDLFDTAIPQIDMIKKTAEVLRELKKYNVPVYVIPGSHDFSYSGKTMLDVLEKAGLLINVMKINEKMLEFTLDQKTGIKITGIYGRKGGLETEEYGKIDFTRIENEIGFKIFMFHTLLTELKPDNFEMIETSSIKLLPKGFDYYAGGHPHFVYGKNHDGYGVVAYPGPTFPNNFEELERLKHGSFFIVDVENKKLSLNLVPLKLIETASFKLDFSGMRAEEAADSVEPEDVSGKIALLRIEGELSSGKVSDVDFKKIFKKFENAHIILKNTSKLLSYEEEQEEVNYGTAAEIEKSIINDYSDNHFSAEFIFELMNKLSTEKSEGERNYDFEERLLEQLEVFLK